MISLLWLGVAALIFSSLAGFIFCTIEGFSPEEFATGFVSALCLVLAFGAIFFSLAKALDALK